MRQFIDLIRLMEGKLPKYVYHGTSDEAWESIRGTDTMMAMDAEDRDSAICFSGSERVAEEFARHSAVADMCEKGVVIAFDAAKLAQLYPIIEYHDPNMAGGWRFFAGEEEYRIEQSPISGIMACVTNTYPVWAESAPEFHERKSDSEIIADAVNDVRNACRGRFQGACEGAAADLSEILDDHHIEHRVVEGRYLKEMEWGDGTTHPFTPHWWVEVGNYILDPTREQFGSSNLIINKNHREARLYAYGGVGAA